MLPGVGPERVLSEGMGQWGQGGAGGLGWKCLGGGGGVGRPVFVARKGQGPGWRGAGWWCRRAFRKDELNSCFFHSLG